MIKSAILATKKQAEKDLKDKSSQFYIYKVVDK
jgi:hypothetical protein